VKDQPARGSVLFHDMARDRWPGDHEAGMCVKPPAHRAPHPPPQGLTFGDGASQWREQQTIVGLQPRMASKGRVVSKLKIGRMDGKPGGVKWA